MVGLFYFAINCHLFNQILNDLFNPGHGSLNTIFGSLQGNLIAGHTVSWEANNNTAKLIPNLPENLTTTCYEIAMVFRIHGHGILYYIVQLVHPGFQFRLSFSYCFLCPYNGDTLPVH